MATEEAKQIAERLQHWLDVRGMEKKDLAYRAGVNPSQVTRYMTGDRRPTLGTMERLALVLEVPTQDIFPRYEEEKARQIAGQAIKNGWMDLHDLADVIEGHRYQEQQDKKRRGEH
jgi:transcriptional regulator with XRE-family HTH domain